MAEEMVVVAPDSFKGAVLRAIIAIAFGVILVAWPSATLKAFLIVFGIFALAFGVFELIANITADADKEHRTWMIIFGAVSAIAGIMALAWPSATTRIILIIIGIWAIGLGCIEIVAAVRLPKQFTGRWLLALFGVISVAIGLWLILGPEAKGSTDVASIVVILVGVFAILEGVLMAIYAYALRKFIKEIKQA